MLSTFKASIDEFKNIRSLTTAGILTAMAFVCASFLVLKFGDDTLRIETRIIPIALAGMLFGPVIGGFVGAASDILSSFTFATPFYGFTLSYFIMGVIFGCFLYNQKRTVIKLILAQITVAITVSISLFTIWRIIMLGPAWQPEIMLQPLLYERIIKTAITTPVEFLVLVLILEMVVPQYSKIGVRR